MPTYEYRCPEGHEFEKFVQKISDAKSELTCPVCGAVAQRRMSAGGGLLFKGSGFYITDYGKDGKKDQRAATTAAGEKSGGASRSDSSASSSAGSSSESGASGSKAASGDAAKSTSGTAPASGAKPAAKSDKPKSGPAK
ncbi:MAG TPA: zinc ribbon domain-containing protein [Gemmatimonadaceae bacterium]|nr:zinc ribbon domain-containing protein [Gemmatimonadaceae bacterium]